MILKFEASLLDAQHLRDSVENKSASFSLCCWERHLMGYPDFRAATNYQKLSVFQGWNVRSVACGGRHIVVAADDSVIVWGVGTSSGELVSYPFLYEFWLCLMCRTRVGFG